MTYVNGEFMLLKSGMRTVRASDYNTVLERLYQDHAKEPQAEYVIVQVVGTVGKPAKPIVHSIYGPNL